MDAAGANVLTINDNLINLNKRVVFAIQPANPHNRGGKWASKRNFI